MAAGVGEDMTPSIFCCKYLNVFLTAIATEKLSFCHIYPLRCPLGLNAMGHQDFNLVLFYTVINVSKIRQQLVLINLLIT